MFRFSQAQAGDLVHDQDLDEWWFLTTYKEHANVSQETHYRWFGFSLKRKKRDICFAVWENTEIRILMDLYRDGKQVECDPKT